MKDLRLTVKISKPTAEVFAFTTNPDNTPRWIDSIVREEADRNPIVTGATFRNWDKQNHMNIYTVTQYDPPSVFQLDARHQDYKVRYTYKRLSENETELEYYEWSESGQLHAPFMQEILDRLKDVMESSDSRPSS